MTWWMWVLVGVLAWLAIGLAVGWLFGHMARVGGDE